MNNENRKYKDTIFRRLFNNKEEIIPLYNQISGNNIAEDAEVEIITLTDTMYVEQVNDLGFTVDDRLVVLVEQQSSINPNMPLRFLLYVAREYEKILERKSIYRERMMKIPTPEFYVLYNGRKRLEKTITKSRLSDLFGKKSDNISLELKVTTLDINSDDFTKALSNTSLYQYILAIKAIQNCVDNDGNLRECIEDLIKKDVLRNFLLENSSEVVNMITFEFDKELYGEVKKEEGREEERLKIIEKLKKKGYSDKEIEDILK